MKNSALGHVILFTGVGVAAGMVLFVALGYSLEFLLLAAAGIAGLAILIAVKDWRRFLLMGAVFTIPLQIDVNFMHSFEYQAGASTAGISLSDLFLFGLLLVNFLEMAIQKKTTAAFFAVISVPAILYFEMAVLSMVWAPRLDLAFMEVFRMFKVLLFYFVLIANVRSARDLRLVLWVLCASLAFQSIIAMLQTWKGGLLGLSFLGEAVPDPDRDVTVWRVMGTLGHPNKLATFVELLISICLALFVIEKSKLKFFSFVIFLAAMMTLIMTGSRGAWISVMLAFVIFFILGILNPKIQLKSLVKPLLILMVVLVIASAAFFDMLKERISGDDYGSAMSRIPMIHIALNVISAHPFTGVGINNYQEKMREYNNSLLARQFTTIPRPVHNMYLLVAGELGIFGFFFMLWMVLAGIFVLLDIVASPNPFYALTAISLFCGIAAFSVHGMVDKHPPGSYVLFYVLLALAAATARLHKTTVVAENE